MVGRLFGKVDQRRPMTQTKQRPARGSRIGALGLALALAAFGPPSGKAQGTDETVLRSFSFGRKGARPSAGVVRDAAGSLYGTTSFGGSANLGTVYKVDTAGHLTVLHSFTGADGSNPFFGVILDSSGNLYGTTISGGGWEDYGVVYRLAPSGELTVLYTFAGPIGPSPSSGVIRDSAGNLYGTTSENVYKLDTAGNITILYGFPNAADGNGPYNGIIRSPSGDFFGTTVGGGTADVGVVYKLGPKGNEQVLYSFTGGSDGAYPNAVTRDSGRQPLRNHGGRRRGELEL
jgi:uncharacterized repeat protein (TIGR03803 family)